MCAGVHRGDDPGWQAISGFRASRVSASISLVAALKPLDGMGGVNPELLSIRQLVSVTGEEGSGCNDAEARGPPRRPPGLIALKGMSLAASMVSTVASRPPSLLLLLFFHLQTAGMAYLG